MGNRLRMRLLLLLFRVTPSLFDMHDYGLAALMDGRMLDSHLMLSLAL